MANAHFDLKSVKSWYDMQTSTYQGKPICLKVEFYQKIGTKTERRDTKNFDRDDLLDLSKADNLAIACQKFNYDAGWNWLRRTIDSFIPSGTTDLTIYYVTSGGAAKSSLPLSLNPKTDMMTFSNIGALSNNNTQSNLIGVLRELVNDKPKKSEDELRKEIRNEFEKERQIEDLSARIEMMESESLGGWQKIGAILESSPELSKQVSGIIGGLAGVLGVQIGNLINNFTKQYQQQQTSVGQMDTDNKEQVVTMKMALEAVQKEFPNTNPIITILKLAKVLEENAAFKPVIVGMMAKIEL